MAAIIDYRGKSPQKSSSGIPLVTAKIVKNGRIEPAEEFILPEDYDSWMSRGLPQEGDVVMTTEAPLGEIAQLDGRKVALAQRLITLRGKPDLLDNTFLKFLMQSAFVQHQLKSRATGTTVLGIRQSELRRIILVLPPLHEQRTIAHILGSLDDKIELNRRVNETLESIGQALFNSWFVDFDPVWAKMEGREPSGMDADTAALFPSSFEETRQGPIPQGWQIGKLGKLVKINERSVTKDYPHRTIRYIDISSVTKGRLRETTQYELTEAPSRARRLVQQGDTIWSTVRPNRKSYLYIQNPVDNYVVSTGFAVLTPHLIPPSYLYKWVTTQQFVDYLSFSADGSAYPAVSPQRFSEAEILLPPTAILEKFERQAGALYKMIAQNEAQAVSLAELRDALSPKLLSGELRTQDVERRVENQTGFDTLSADVED